MPMTDFFENKKVVVTGATGLLGRHLIEGLLPMRATIRAVVHKRPFFNQDITNFEFLKADLTEQAECDKVMSGMDIACLCASVTVGAAQAINNPMLAVTSNLVMAARSLQAACLAGIKRVLLVSSTTVYPAYPRPVREEEAFIDEPHSAYQGVGNMKRYVESLAKFYCEKYGMKISVVRPVPFYGRFDNFDFETCHVIPALIRKAVEQQDPFEIWSNGKEIRDFLHVSDVARGCLLALERYPHWEGVNLGSGASVSIQQLAETILQLSGCRSRIMFDPTKPTTIPIRVVDTNKALEKLGFKAAVGLEEGLTDTINWFKENQLHLVKKVHT
ncbi:NAD(P)-dependent oxidoreductase [Candidatus Nitronereus thalassa]|uniref:NAD(P)-dependent oxidoreductase n=1 Tax=Candidatus Nitronereus thalassa TaxID=3020898 RepID=A0ABU3K5H8_9BACT|nr:NAD(P)-dependent oxidoreductase [Candidatus Nitronereus thalassa]MDT7041672.1 NAD(P)-dependent oxidoreductase [Candidatus Nitronereus thalassa]